MISLLVDAVLAGAILCLASLGLSLAYAIFRFPNFAHAEFLTVGAYGAFVGFTMAAPAMNEPIQMLAGAIVAILAAALVAALAGRIVFQPLVARGGGPALIIAAFATGLLIRNLIVFLFGPTELYLQRELEIAENIGYGVRLTPTEIGILIATAVVIYALHLVMSRTTFGRCLRATAENPDLASVTAIPVDRIRLGAWLLAGFYCALSGLALTLLAPIRPETGYEYLLPALAAVILGGLGSIYGTLVGAMLIGLAEAAAVHYGFAEWRQVISFGLIILILMVRPNGLMGRAAS
ncbi:branched-chain amino acid ABC transporter permease [Amorphus orientalis]|uniref:Branched-chain amino acid transport system permease protein n=1 Tax=Amorphus orientalis TaxID=649198 RepID=A0AAE3VRX1_9HYPH|nr:branched-chain amino acid ABC transporter permease [Amorphus orientalis]MDQ0316833.1 branched-chain amino acid transport system permease protein [Amorphus orientalis]